MEREREREHGQNIESIMVRKRIELRKYGFRTKPESGALATATGN